LFLTRSGSALRLSQPLSGFAASSSSTALFRAATVPDRLLQSVPLAQVVCPSRGHWLPCGYPPALCADRADDNPRVSPNAHARRRSGPDSLAAGGRFRRAEARLPLPPGRRHGTVTSRQLHPLRSFAPSASPFAPRRVAPTRRPLLSWTFRPSKGPFQASEPLTRPTSRAEHLPSPEGSS